MKYKVKTLEELPEAQRALYKKVGDWFVLQVEGLEGGGDGGDDDAEAKKKLKEFRDNNITLKKDLDAATATLKQFEGIDPKKIKELSELSDRMDKDEDSKLIKEGKIDELLKKRVGALTDQYDKNVKRLQDQIKAQDEAGTAVRSRLSNLVLDQTIMKVVSDTGVMRQGAQTDILNRARAVFKVNDKDELETEAQDEKMNVFTPQTWAKKLVVDAPYLFESASGGGASGGNRGAAKGGQRVISNDAMDFGRNLEDIAKGKVTTMSGAAAGG